MKNQAAVELGRLGGLKGGKARAAALTQEERTAIAKKAANARWEKTFREDDVVRFLFPRKIKPITYVEKIKKSKHCRSGVMIKTPLKASYYDSGWFEKINP